MAFLLVSFIATLIRISDFFLSIGGNQLQPSLPESEVSGRCTSIRNLLSPACAPYLSFLQHSLSGENDAAVADFLDENVGILALYSYSFLPVKAPGLFSNEAFRAKYIKLLKTVATSELQLDKCPVAEFPIYLLDSQYVTESDFAAYLSDEDLFRYFMSIDKNCPEQNQSLRRFSL